MQLHWQIQCGKFKGRVSHTRYCFESVVRCLKSCLFFFIFNHLTILIFFFFLKGLQRVIHNHRLWNISKHCFTYSQTQSLIDPYFSPHLWLIASWNSPVNDCLNTSSLKCKLNICFNGTTADKLSKTKKEKGLTHCLLLDRACQVSLVHMGTLRSKTKHSYI